MGQLADGMTNRMAKRGFAIPLSMARTDGRTNGRLNHLPASSSVPKRARKNEGEIMAAPELSEAEFAEVERFGLDRPEAGVSDAAS